MPTDFSKQAEKGSKVAAHFARRCHGEIYLLHLIELPENFSNPVGDTRSSGLPDAIFFMKMAKKKFNEVIPRPYISGIKIYETFEINQAFKGIMEAAKKQACDYFVMGSQGASGFKEMFIGSNTEKVVRTSKIPVLVINNDHPAFEINNFVFATNLEEQGKVTLKKVVAFAQMFTANLHLVYINTANGYKTSKAIVFPLRKYIEGLNSNYEYYVYIDTSVEEGIFNFTRKINADLIGVATHGRKGLAHFFNGSISEDLVNHANSPVITFKLEN